MTEWRQLQEKLWRSPGITKGTFLQIGNLWGCGIMAHAISGIIETPKAITDTPARNAEGKNPMGNLSSGKTKPAGRLPGAFTRSGKQNGRWHKKRASTALDALKNIINKPQSLHTSYHAQCVLSNRARKNKRQNKRQVEWRTDRAERPFAGSIRILELAYLHGRRNVLEGCMAV